MLSFAQAVQKQRQVVLVIERIQLDLCVFGKYKKKVMKDLDIS